MEDSSDDEPAANAAANKSAQRARTRQKKEEFSTQTVLNAVLGESETEKTGKGVKGVQQHLPAFFTADTVQSWRDWAKRTPNHLSEVPEEQRMRKCDMPRKCLPADQQAIIIPRIQKELITYKNANSEAISRRELQREGDSAKPLDETEISVGSIVALKRADESHVDEPGYDTPFYIGDVKEITLKPGAADDEAADEEAADKEAASSSAARVIESVLIHYRMPRLRSNHCNDLTKKWTLVCNGGSAHEWTRQCERRRECRLAAKNAGQEASAMTHVANPAEIFETNLVLTGAEKLTIETRERLASAAHAPADGSWRDALALPPLEKKQQPKSRKKSRLK